MSVDVVDGLRGVDLYNLVVLLVVFYNWHTRLDKRFEALLDALFIVVFTAARLSSFQETLKQDFL